VVQPVTAAMALVVVIIFVLLAGLFAVGAWFDR
jgi:hypothetical protein